MRKTFWLALTASGCFLFVPKIVQAGMLSPMGDDVVQAIRAEGLREFAIARLQNISFFLVGFLLSAFLIKLLWNYLRKDWAFLPRLSYPGALGVIFLWGLLFVLVLTMISGARELMTPGAWKKQGLTYVLPPPEGQPPVKPDTPLDKRYKHMLKLRDALESYAYKHDYYYPKKLPAEGIDEELLQVPDSNGMKYYYVPGSRREHDNAPLVYEPDIFGPDRYVLYANGLIKLVNSNELPQAKGPENP